MDDRFNALIEALLRGLVPGFVELLSCRQLTAGANQETWRIDYRDSGGEASLALRRTQATASDAATIGTIDLATEARLLRLAAAGGVPVPEVRGELRAQDDLGEGFLMQWLEGETLGGRINRSDELGPARRILARQCGEILGRIHALDWAEAGLAEELVRVEPPQLVEQTWSIYRELQVPVPMIDYCWRWLQDNLPRQSRQTLVHGDFRNGNLMVTPGGVAAVLDWELAHIGDPLRDLGWLCVNSWRFGNSHLPVGGFGTVEELLAGYEATSGVIVEPEELLFWQVFGSFWWAVTTLHMAHSWRSGETPSLERPVIGRRSSEAQMDCVNLLIPGTFQLPDASTRIDRGTQLPMPAELIEGAAVFLKEEAPDCLDSHRAFLARVAANSLRIAQRELLHGPVLARREADRLQDLLSMEDELDALRWRLVDRLRNGLSLETPGLAHHLRQTVAGQLFIDQPRYSALLPESGPAAAIGTSSGESSV